MKLSRMWIDENGMIDIMHEHNILVMKYKLSGREEIKVKMKKKNWGIKDVNLNSFQVGLSERRWENESSLEVNGIIERFTKNMRTDAARQTGFVRQNVRASKAWRNNDIRDASR